MEFTWSDLHTYQHRFNAPSVKKAVEYLRPRLGRELPIDGNLTVNLEGQGVLVNLKGFGLSGHDLTNVTIVKIFSFDSNTPLHVFTASSPSCMLLRMSKISAVPKFELQVTSGNVLPQTLPTLEDRLETIIDSHGLSATLDTLSALCLDRVRNKSHHPEASGHPSPRDVWKKMAEDIEKLARRAKKFGMGS